MKYTKFLKCHFDVILFTFAIMTYLAVCDAQTVWEKVPQTPMRAFRGIAHGNGTFVAADFWGSIIYSTDGKNWDDCDSIQTDYLYNTEYHNGFFFVLGEDGTLMKSSDGRSWASCNTGINADYFDITYGKGLYIAVGEIKGSNPSTSAIASSTDGENWNYQKIDSTSGLFSIIYAESSFVASGDDGHIYRSSNGTDWQKVDSISPFPIKCMAYGDSVYVAFDNFDIFTSRDLQYWSRLYIRDEFGEHIHIRSALYHDSTFLAVGKSDSYQGMMRVLTSTDGYSWTRPEKYKLRNNLFDVCVVDSTYYAVGTDSLIVTSQDRVNWEYNIPEKHLCFSEIIYANNCFVAVGEGGLLSTSTDGINWVCKITGTYQPIKDIAYGNDRFVAVGYTSTYTDTQCIIISSDDDGISWNTLYRSGATYLWGITYGDGMFISCGSNTNTYYTGLILTSTTGIGFSNSGYEFRGSFYDVAYGNGTYVVTGRYDANNAITFISSSDNGDSWDFNYGYGQKRIYELLFDNTQFIATGKSSTGPALYTSSDGATWTKKELDTSLYMFDLIYENSQYVAIGGNKVMVSQDLDSWRTYSMPFSQSMTTLAFGKDMYVAAGDSCSILYSRADPVSSLNLPEFAKQKFTVKTINNNIVLKIPEHYSNDITTIKLYSISGRCLYEKKHSVSKDRIQIPITVANGRYLIIVSNRGKRLLTSSLIVQQ